MSKGSTSFNGCHICHAKDHMANECLRYATTKLKCEKCGGLHDEIENCGLRCIFCGGPGHTKEHFWKKDSKPSATTTNYLELLVDIEKAISTHLDKICGDNHELFSHTRVPKRWVPVDATIGETKTFNPTNEEAWWRREKTIGLEKKSAMRSKIFTHFIKGKISLTPIETILTIPRELEYLEGLVKLAHK